MIEFSHVYKTYTGPVHALRDVHFRIEKGEFVFLTGPSGAGKTTLFKLICGFDRPTSGRVQVAGFDLGQVNATQLAFFRRQVGVVFQDFKLLLDRSLFDNVALPLRVRGDSEDLISQRVNEMLDRVGLLHRAHHLPRLVSGGEQQRAAIARALAPKPGVLIADEPTGNLDPSLSQEIMSLLMDLSSQGTTVFVATHDQALVARGGKRHLTIQAGQLSEASPEREVQL